MERIGALETVCRYPVKSMAGEELEVAFVGFAGLMGDRAYAFVRAPGPKGFPWHTGREQEDLVLYRPRYREMNFFFLPTTLFSRKNNAISECVVQVHEAIVTSLNRNHAI